MVVQVLAENHRGKLEWRANINSEEVIDSCTRGFLLHTDLWLPMPGARILIYLVRRHT